jgi:hypothetical protein
MMPVLAAQLIYDHAFVVSFLRIRRSFRASHQVMSLPTLSSSTSIFQLAVGVNAALPVLISDYERMRDRAAESMLRKIHELNPDFELKERDREEFISFTLRSIAGLRHAQRLTHYVVALSITLSAIALIALCWAAIDPDQVISIKQLLTFVGVTLIAGPAFYVLTNRHLKWLYSILVKHASNEEVDAALFADIVTSYLAFQIEMGETRT